MSSASCMASSSLENDTAFFAFSLMDAVSACSDHARADTSAKVLQWMHAAARAAICASGSSTCRGQMSRSRMRLHLEAAVVARVGDGRLVFARGVQEDAREAVHLERLVLIGLRLDLRRRVCMFGVSVARVSGRLYTAHMQSNTGRSLQAAGTDGRHGSMHRIAFGTLAITTESVRLNRPASFTHVGANCSGR